ncbi:WD40 repeat-like protein [Sporormia fimetaria CBS 119925]|uniref:WD40 repeat-like protein n=1 Tax=Sporormia fimetaria CBS 119925 TaxID=1340428 RepID=A0A6A6VHF2_9PLEO|nr:WD40 repeat-like protein [Sporormia fimetaria CBS 119925]
MAGAPHNNAAGFAVPSYIQAFRPASSMSFNKFDEGYSEDTKSQSESDIQSRMDVQVEEIPVEQASLPLPDWVLNMGENERSDFAYAILRSLRTSTIADIVAKLNPLLHLDPVMYLPPEITFHIFSYLSPETLLRASTLSKAWRARVMDSPLWKLLFRLEGWEPNIAQVRTFEEAERSRLAQIKGRRTRSRTSEGTERDKPLAKKRLQEGRLFGDSDVPDKSLPGSEDGLKETGFDWTDQNGPVEADESPNEADPMEGVAYQEDSTSITPDLENASISRTSSYERDWLPPPRPADSLPPPVRPTLLLPSFPEPKINWLFLYKQRKRLEDNWAMGRFTNFQLPHPDHLDERHTECVYTLQFSGKWLVSGSRDKSVRIWNLDTQRLAHPPLQEHTASVLCLQFDERPDQDILITSGSDRKVILWQFSTGKLIKKIEEAHSESVLNLRFDDNYLVTCSKDKTIKVWNRKSLLPTDDAYPSSTTKSRAHFPPYIINMREHVETTNLHFKPLEPYTLLMTMEGHGAAVNAIQIHDGQIVSASGDRNIKVWDVRTGACMRTFSGHNKGIACVQFDGRRIVSGSSDESVRIFDRATGVEVACLIGHGHLVRTVQAQFGDLPGNEQDLEAEARAADRSYWEARRNGRVPEEMSRTPNPGSRDPSLMNALGAKLPPGGGGSKWARIVSGSYDETIIIWKRGPDGAWFKARVLYQTDAARAAGGRPRNNNRRVAGANPTNNTALPLQLPAPAQNGQPNYQVLVQQAQANAQAAHHLAVQAAALHAASLAQPQPTASVAPPIQAAAHSANSTPPANPAQPAANQNQGAVVAQPPAANGPGHHHHHHHHHGHHANPAGTARVFKLQFDARRIICCSQDYAIVGWDFANNDKDIILASQFFGEPQ